MTESVENQRLAPKQVRMVVSVPFLFKIQRAATFICHLKSNCVQFKARSLKFV